jgi:hypothetical protein
MGTGSDVAASYEAELSAFLKDGPSALRKPESPAPAPAPAPDSTTNTTSTADSSQSTSSSPSTESTPAGATPPQPAPAPPAPEPDDDALPKDGTLPKKMRIPISDAFDMEVVKLRKDGYQWHTAADMAAQRYPDAPGSKAYLAGRSQSPAPAPAPNSASPPLPASASSSTPSTLEALDAALAAAEDKFDECMLNVDEPGMKEARKQIRELQRQRPELIQRQQQQQDTAQAEHNRLFAESLASAEELYPAMKDPNSPLTQRAQAIQADLQRNNDPLYFAPESALIIVQRAARELRVSPSPLSASPAASPAASHPAPPSASPASPTQAATPAPNAHRLPPGAAMIASGNARTQQPGPPSLDVSKIKDSDDYEAALKLVGIR